MKKNSLNMRFIGVPDSMFPDLITGKNYNVMLFSSDEKIFVYIEGEFKKCPYDSLNAFFKNWEFIK